MDEARSALIVAIDDYVDPGLRLLRAPAKDAEALAAVLRDPEVGAFQVQTLLNQPSYVVNEAVEEFFADRRPADLLLVHFSCHGIKDEDGELYFATSNTVVRRLGATAIAAEFVSRRMSRSRSRRVVLLLDCCYAGAFERGLIARATSEIGIEQRFGGRGRAVITASSAMEYAFEAGELTETRPLGPSVFTRALVEGLATGEADRDQDGLVGLDELYDYVYDKVRQTTPNQTPGKWTFGVEGELYIARRSRPVTTPVPLPPELEQAIESPLAGIRAAVVRELAAVLQGSHAGKALAARMALERLADDDSRSVAAAATAVLGGQAPPRLAVSAAVIDFGQLQQQGQPPERRVWIGNTGGGVLNARATTTASWLTIRQVGDELVITVNTDAPGAHEGTVTIDSDGGLASVRVLAQILGVQGTAPSALAAPQLDTALATPLAGGGEQPPDPALATITTDVPELGPYFREEMPSTPRVERGGAPRPRNKARDWTLVSVALAVAACLAAIVVFVISRGPTPTPPGSQPAFQVLSMTFISNSQGFALGTVACRSGRCIALLGTQDGGATWSQLTAPTRNVARHGACQVGRQCVQQVRFATSMIGYAYDPSLFMTTDGGVHWTRIGAGASSLESTDPTVVWVASRAAGCRGQRPQVDWASIGTYSWQALPPPPISTICPPLLYRQANRLVLVGYGNMVGGVHPTAKIYLDENIGSAWIKVPDSCGAKDGYASSVALAKPTFIALLCQPRAQGTTGGFGPAWVRISTDDGSTFGPEEVVPPRVGPPNSKISYQLAAATGSQLLVAETGPRGTKLLVTGNGGLTWSTSLSLPGNGTVILVGYEDQNTGRVAQGNIVWTTTDGGSTWTSDHFKHS